MGEVMRIGLVGLGDIARKAYLPALAGRADIELHLCTRNREILHAAGDSYRVEHRYPDLDALIAAGVEAAFVHVAPAQKSSGASTRRVRISSTRCAGARCSTPRTR